MKKALTIGAAAGAVLVIAAAVFVLDDRARKQNTAEAPAEILRVQSAGSSSSRQRRVRVHYQYVLSGRTIQDSTTAPRSENWRPGQTAKVCYDPADPGHHRLERADYRCGT